MVLARPLRVWDMPVQKCRKRLDSKELFKRDHKRLGANIVVGAPP